MRLCNPGHDILPGAEYSTMLRVVATAASLCYGKKTPVTREERESFIRARIKAGHESVIEHVGFSAALYVDRGVTHELVRHRLCSFTQESTRYCNYTNEEKYGGQVTFIKPPDVNVEVPDGVYTDIDTDPNDTYWLCQFEGQRVQVSPAVWVWAGSLLSAEQAYQTLVTRLDVLPEHARGVLPTATAAHIVVTANMREWRHIFRLRALGTTGRPHPQMVQVMDGLLQAVKLTFPIFFEDL